MRMLRLSLVLLLLGSLIPFMGCGDESSTVTGLQGPGADKGVVGWRPGQGLCGCDPYDEDEAILIKEVCGRETPTGDFCFELNVSGSFNPWDPDREYCAYTIQKKTEYIQQCTVTFQCLGAPYACTIYNYTKCVWKSEVVEEGPLVLCSDVPWDLADPICDYTHSCGH